MQWCAYIVSLSRIGLMKLGKHHRKRALVSIIIIIITVPWPMVNIKVLLILLNNNEYTRPQRISYLPHEIPTLKILIR
jgi:hypothetical protein